MTTSIISLATAILRPIIPIALFLIMGIATALSGWVIPILLLPTTPSRTLVYQFNEIIRRGYLYLQSSSRNLAVLLVATTVLTYYHPDPIVASKWKLYSAATLVLVQVAWYEVVFIFPINDKVAATGAKMDGDDLWLPDSEHEKLRELVRSWRRWHFGRIAIPFAVGCLTLVASL